LFLFFAARIAGIEEFEDSNARYEKYKSEMVILESFYELNCMSASKKVLSSFCKDLETKIDAYKNPSKVHTGEEPQDEKHHAEPVIGPSSHSEGEDASRLLDDFLSELSRLISDAIKHVVVPPTPLFSPHFAFRVNFHIFLISNHQVSYFFLFFSILFSFFQTECQSFFLQEYNPREWENFDFDEFKDEVNKLRLPSQQFLFSLKQYVHLSFFVFSH
jgi:hypothetical protein